MRNTTSPGPTGPPNLPRTRRPKPPPPGIDVPVGVWLAPHPAPSPDPDAGRPLLHHDPTKDPLPDWARERLRAHVATPGTTVTAVRVRPDDRAPLPHPADGARLLVVADLDRAGDDDRPEAPARLARTVRRLLARVPASPGSTAFVAIAIPPEHTADGRLVDRCGPAVREARLCDWRYLQHLIVVHAQLHDGHLVPHTPLPRHDDRHDVIHTDVLLLERSEYTP